MKTAEKSKKIQQRVFSKENIRQLWEIADGQFNNSLAKKNRASVDLTLKCDDGMKYTSESDDLLEDGDIIDKKNCASIDIEYHDYSENKRISVTLSRRDSYLEDCIVRGEKAWVIDVFDEIDTVINSAKKQKGISRKFRSPLFHFVGFILGASLLIGALMALVWIKDSGQGSSPERSVIYLGVFYFLLISWLVGVVPLELLVKGVWPSIEFDFGPKYHRNSEKIKAILKFLGLMILLPLSISFFTALVS